jgi:hypothetical protein
MCERTQAPDDDVLANSRLSPEPAWRIARVAKRSLTQPSCDYRGTRPGYRVSSAHTGSKHGATFLFLPPINRSLKLGIDLTEPFLSAVAFLLSKPKLGLYLGDPIFGRAELMGKLLSQVEMC